MVFEVFLGAFIALTIHSLIQVLVIDALMTAIKIRRLTKAADAVIAETGRLRTANSTRYNKPISLPDQRLAAIFNEELNNYREKND